MSRIPVLRPKLKVNYLSFLFSNKKGLIESFERRFAKYIGKKYAIFTNSGTFSLYLCLEELKLQKGDEIIVSGLMVKEVIDVIRMLKLKPVFVDIDDTYNLDSDLIQSKITKKTKVILMSHLFGNPANVDKIKKIAKKNKLKIVEDAAQSLGIKYKGRKLGSFGDLSYFSFGTLKSFTTLGGGMILTDKAEYYRNIKRKVEKLNRHSRISLFKKWIRIKLIMFSTNLFVFSVFTYYVRRLFGAQIKNVFKKKKINKNKFMDKFGYRISNFQAYIGLKNLAEINKHVERKIKLSKLYSEKLEFKSGRFRVFYITPHPEELSEYLLNKGIQCSLGFIKSYLEDSKAEKTRNQMLFLPFFSEMSEQHIIYICEKIRNFNVH